MKSAWLRVLGSHCLASVCVCGGVCVFATEPHFLQAHTDNGGSLGFVLDRVIIMRLDLHHNQQNQLGSEKLLCLHLH